MTPLQLGQKVWFINWKRNRVEECQIETTTLSGQWVVRNTRNGKYSQGKSLYDNRQAAFDGLRSGLQSQINHLTSTLEGIK